MAAGTHRFAAEERPCRIRDRHAGCISGASVDVSEDCDHLAANDLLAAAEKAFPDGRKKVPPLRAIQSTLGVGQPRA